MLWVIKATYQGDVIEFPLITDKDDLMVALKEARAEACRIFQWVSTPYDKPEAGPTVHIKKNPTVL